MGLQIVPCTLLSGSGKKYDGRDTMAESSDCLISIFPVLLAHALMKGCGGYSDTTDNSSNPSAPKGPGISRKASRLQQQPPERVRIKVF